MTDAPLADRSGRLARLAEARLDVVVVGGGITGAGIAADLRSRGLATALLERDDWACATSSASSRLVHGGLRYLEQLELGLVRESCLERALLLRNAAGYVWPESFVFPVRRGDRIGRLRMGAGLWLYTALSLPHALGRPRLLSRGAVERRMPGIDRGGLAGGGSYLDGATDDARLTLAVVASAACAGAHVLSRAEVRSIERSRAGVEVGFVDRTDETERALEARVAVLAGGPFTESLRAKSGLTGTWIAPTRGSHVVVPRDRLPTAGAVVLPSAVDGRVMFILPWPRFTVVGTTDLDASPDEPVFATEEEVDYLLESVDSLVPGAKLGRDDVVSTWAGLRPLLASASTTPSARSREERVEQDGPVFTVAGGKLTGYRAMAEKLAPRVVEAAGNGDRSPRSSTRGARLFGALPAPLDEPRWVTRAAVAPEDEARRHAWTKRYGALAGEVERSCASAEDGERALGPETRLGEVDWAVTREDCLSPVDFFLRRTDLGHDPAGRAPGVRDRVVRRMGSLLRWDERAVAAARAELDGTLERAEAWKGR